MIELLYSEASAPGLTSQPPYFQAGEGLRMKPSLRLLRLNYLVNFSQFVAPGNSQYSFRRWTTDLDHEIPLYHSVRIGFLFSIDEGKVASRRDDIDFTHMRHSFSTGLTVHAGGLPVIHLLFAWGGNEGHHVIANVDSTLLGAYSRPSLF